MEKYQKARNRCNLTIFRINFKCVKRVIAGDIMDIEREPIDQLPTTGKSLYYKPGNYSDWFERMKPNLPQIGTTERQTKAAH